MVSPDYDLRFAKLDRRAPMQPWLTYIRGVLSGWLQAALSNAKAARQSRMFPAWLAVTAVLIDFGLLGLWFHYTDQSWSQRWVVSAAMMFLLRLATVTVILTWACRHYGVSAAALGIRPSTMLSDFRWSFRICALGGLVLAATVVAGFSAALGLGIRLPAPSESSVQFLCGNWSVGHAVFMVGVGITGNMLVVVTEELIYRSLFLPPLTSRLGLFPAVMVTAIVFGLAHVIPFGRMEIPLPEIIGGILMAGFFSIRWSVIPAMVVHAMGNLFAGALVFAYVQLFMTCPALFLGQ
jgi:membrane protease YdiL (CAAX protease family)